MSICVQMIVRFSNDNEKTLHLSREQNTGMAMLEIAWTARSVSALKDTMSAFGLAFSNGGIKPKEPAQPWNYELQGLNRTLLHLENLQVWFHNCSKMADGVFVGSPHLDV